MPSIGVTTRSGTTVAEPPPWLPDASAARAKIELTNGTAEELAPTADVNTTDTVDINDAQLVYDLYNAKYADFEHVSMQKFLAADQNADGVLTVQDASAVVRTMLAGE